MIWLKECGFHIWYDEGIEAGTEWRGEIARAIENASIFLYFVTASSTASDNCRNEVNFAADAKITIVTIFLEDIELPGGMKLILADRQAVLKHQLRDEEYRRKLQEALANLQDSDAAVNPASPAPRVRTSVVRRVMSITLSVIAILGLTAGGLYYYWQPAEASIAVLPYRSTTSDEQSIVITEGLNEELFNQMAQSEVCFGPSCESVKVPTRRDMLEVFSQGENVQKSREAST